MFLIALTIITDQSAIFFLSVIQLVLYLNFMEKITARMKLTAVGSYQSKVALFSCMCV